MTTFLGRALSDALRIGLSITLALLAMQLPAFSHQYTAALLQVADGERRDIQQREAAARSFYPAAGNTDDSVIAALQPVEPANAQALRASVVRSRALTAAHDRIESAPLLLQPLQAALDLADDDPGSGKRAVLLTTFDTYVPQLLFRADAIIYALAGLLLGSVLAAALTSLASAMTRPSQPRRAPIRSNRDFT